MRDGVALSASDVTVLAQVAGLMIHSDHLPGVTRNLEILFGQAALLFEAPLDPLVEPAPVYRP